MIFTIFGNDKITRILKYLFELLFKGVKVKLMIG